MSDPVYRHLIAPLPWIKHDGGRRAAGFAAEGAGDCSTRAVAIATGMPYREVYDLIIEVAKRERPGGRAPGRSHPNRGVYRKTMHRVMERLGWGWHSTMGIGTGCRVHMRVGELPEVGRFVVNLSKHYTAVIDGAVCDTYDPCRDGFRCVYGYWFELPDGGVK